MKKITLLLAIFAMSSVVVGQNSTIKKIAPANKKNTTVVDRKLSNNSTFKQENPGSISTAAVVWSDDFSVPANWIRTSSVGAGIWVINTVGPTGAFAIPKILSTTAANGFGLFDSDLDCSGNQIADITTASSINCSANPAVVLKFQQQYRRFYDSTFVYVSNNGTTWVKYPVNAGVMTNGYSGANPTLTSVNITSTAGGQATVWIRFTFYSPSSLGGLAGCAYSWMIDDVSIEDLPANDITLGTLFYGEYSRIPNGQQSPITLGGAISNTGASTQTNVTLSASVNGTLFGTSTPIASLPIITTDTVAITTLYTPGAIGNYAFTFAATQTEADNNLLDNVSGPDTIKVTANTFARDNYKYTGSGSWNGAGNAYEMGNLFTMAASTNAISVTFVLQGNTFPGSTVNVKLYDSSFTTPIAASTGFYAITAGDIPASFGSDPLSVTIPFDLPVYLTGNSDYLAVVESFGATDTVVLATGSDIAQPIQTSFLYDPGTATWYYTTATPMVRLNVSSTIGINEINSMNGITLFQNQPNPFSTISTINYELKETAAISFNVFDVTGKVVATQNIGEQNVGTHTVKFNAENLSAGVYYYSLKVNNNSSSAMKMVIIK